MRSPRATVSGSFTRHLHEIQAAVTQLKQRGIRVLSPENPTIVGAVDGFLFVESDRHRSVKLVQDRHLASIRESDFLWLEAPDGYVGSSAALEVGFAIASGIPVFSISLPTDLTMRQYVCRVSSLNEAISRVMQKPSRQTPSVSLLVDPDSAADEASRGIENLRRLLKVENTGLIDSRLDASVMIERQKAVSALAILPAATSS